MSKSTELVAVSELTVARTGLSAAVTALQKKCKASISGGESLTSVCTEDEGIFWNSEHEVTGREFNTLVTQIQKALSQNADQRKSLWNSLIEVYTTIDSLDKDYLSKIEMSFDQINENYGRIKKNHEAICQDQKNIECHRIRIDELIDGHEKALAVLKKFKAKIEKLEHLEEINTLLERIDIEKTLKQVDSNYRNLLQVSDKHSKAIESVRAGLQILDDNGESARVGLKQAHEDLVSDFLKFKSDVERRMSELDLVAAVNGVREDCVSISNKSKEQSESIAVLKDEIGGLNKRTRNCMIVAWVSVILVFLLVAMVSIF